MNKSRAHKLINRFSEFHIGVIGDIIFDKYIWGHASRISPEAPVPVVQVQNKTTTLGGAANVLRNLSSLGVQAIGFGIIGADSDGAELTRLCNKSDINTDGLIVDKTRITTVKTRLIANNQQVARIDDEIASHINNELTGKLIASITNSIENGKLDALIIEDYNKGVITNSLISKIIKPAQSRCIPVALDPHPGNELKMKGITLLTPNRQEAFALAGEYLTPSVFPIRDDQKLLKVGDKLLSKSVEKMLLITLGPGGMALFEKGKNPIHIPTLAQEVFDVSGAGDTVIATFMSALLAGAKPLEAAAIANHAAGIVVGKAGTVPVDNKSLLNSFKN